MQTETYVHMDTHARKQAHSQTHTRAKTLSHTHRHTRKKNTHTKHILRRIRTQAHTYTTANTEERPQAHERAHTHAPPPLMIRMGHTESHGRFNPLFPPPPFLPHHSPPSPASPPLPLSSPPLTLLSPTPLLSPPSLPNVYPPLLSTTFPFVVLVCVSLLSPDTLVRSSLLSMHFPLLTANTCYSGVACSVLKGGGWYAPPLAVCGCRALLSRFWSLWLSCWLA